MSFAEFTAPASPLDPVSALGFYHDVTSPSASHLLVSSWDKFVRLYDLTEHAAGSAPILKSFEHPAPVLDVCWISDTLAASACLDRRVRLLHLGTGQVVIVGKHENGVCRVRYDVHTRLLLSGSWDATVHLYDPHTDPDSCFLRTLRLPDKVFAMDTVPVSNAPNGVRVQDTTPRLVVATAGRGISIFNLHTIRDALDRDVTEDAAFAPEQTRESSLKFMLRDVRCMPDGLGYATSSVEGRIAVEFFDPRPAAQAQKYAFKCHRKDVDGVDIVYPVNTMGFHAVYGTFASGGGDAHCALWDPIAKKRIRQYILPSPISALAFSADGALLTIASGGENLDDTENAGGIARAGGCQGALVLF
ncbi:hypothetical protein MVES_002284 [Malassezia vespertilionis]|uniref:Bub3p n=1 Tax=Malassezia vespertilionis TaxID=2020962 RepID=A0A2N1JB96_9BASI|nr:hypothetical protein MVES_002284 [Malassezia vespertilionis]